MSAAHSRGRARIFSQNKIAKGYQDIRLEYGDDRPVRAPRPGSFFTILPVNYPLQTMRRPFAYSASDEKGFSFIYEVRGDASSDISDLPDGSELDWIGPLGTSFPEPSEGKRPVLIAGGIGVGPIYYLAHKLAGSSSSVDSDPLVIIGARTAALVPGLDWPTNVELRICTDDGSTGIHGNALSALKHTDTADAEFYTCGPQPMMAAIHRTALDTDATCWASMEEMMACGVGACQGCAVEMAERGADGWATYTRACVEGPIFDSRELAW